jgi:hypothetical protein
MSEKARVPTHPDFTLPVKYVVGFQAVGGDTEVSENRLPLTPLFAFASRHCCPAAPAETGSICSAYVVCIFGIIRLFEAVEKLRETGLQ